MSTAATRHSSSPPRRRVLRHRWRWGLLARSGDAVCCGIAGGEVSCTGVASGCAASRCRSRWLVRFRDALCCVTDASWSARTPAQRGDARISAWRRSGPSEVNLYMAAPRWTLRSRNKDLGTRREIGKLAAGKARPRALLPSAPGQPPSDMTWKNDSSRKRCQGFSPWPGSWGAGVAARQKARGVWNGGSGTEAAAETHEAGRLAAVHLPVPASGAEHAPRPVLEPGGARARVQLVAAGASEVVT